MMLRTLTAVVFALGLFWSVGCDAKKEAPKADDKKEKEKEEDDHSHGAGPHGGVILELGKFHGEFKPDHAKKEATVWILKGDAVTPARVKAEKLRLVISNTDPKIAIDLLPADEADGTASVFVGKHDGFAKEMEYKGTVSGTINGKNYSYDFEEKPEAKK